MTASNDIEEIYILLKGEQADRKDGGLCEDVKENTRFRKQWETKRDRIWIGVAISLILAIMSFFSDKIFG